MLLNQGPVRKFNKSEPRRMQEAYHHCHRIFFQKNLLSIAYETSNWPFSYMTLSKTYKTLLRSTKVILAHLWFRLYSLSDCHNFFSSASFLFHSYALIVSNQAFNLINASNLCPIVVPLSPHLPQNSITKKNSQTPTFRFLV